MKIECGNCGVVESDNRMYFVSRAWDEKKLTETEYGNLNMINASNDDYVFLCKKCYVKIRKKRGEVK